MRRSPFVVLAVLAAVGCAAPGMLGDGSSISIGTINHGALRHGRALPFAGEGYRVPPLWEARANHFGTDEIVRAIQRAARRVRREHPGGTLGVADLSGRGGGLSPFHKSHENGRDADLIYYALASGGRGDRPVPPVDSMPRYRPGDLAAYAPNPAATVPFGPFSPRRFDVRRNWALVRALLQDPDAEVQYLFIHEGLKQRLLDHARAIGEDAEASETAQSILRQPSDSLPHDDHLHLRVYCAGDDRAYGCLDWGPVRWWKKRYKYMAPYGRGAIGDVVFRLLTSPPFLGGFGGRAIP